MNANNVIITKLRQCSNYCSSHVVIPNWIILAKLEPQLKNG